MNFLGLYCGPNAADKHCCTDNNATVKCYDRLFQKYLCFHGYRTHSVFSHQEDVKKISFALEQKLDRKGIYSTKSDNIIKVLSRHTY